MSMPFKPNALHSLLTFDGMVKELRQAATQFTDKRRGDNAHYRIEEYVLSAFAVFYFQCPSFLAFQRLMEKRQSQNNARSLFGIEAIPSDNQIRQMLDHTAPEILFPVFDAFFHALHTTKQLDEFVSLQDNLLIALDGVEHHRSTDICCDRCRVSQHRNGQVDYAHQILTAVLLTPGCPHVIDLAPEFITPQDGHAKQDCEIAAAKRWLVKQLPTYQVREITLLGDDLFCHQPFCEAVLKRGAHFIFTCKPESHKITYEWIEGLKRTKINSIEVSRWTGKRRETDHYYYANQVPLRDGEDALFINWCEIITTDAADNTLHHHAFATDHVIRDDTVAAIVQAGRARWKTENENNNTMKNHGYHLSHNFGHGKNQLSNVLATLNLLAFLFHTFLERWSEAYQKVRQALGPRYNFFDHLRTLTQYIFFASWDKLMSFMLDQWEIRLDSS